MDVDVTTSSNSAKTVPTTCVAQLALTPFNNSPSTPKGKEIVERARQTTPGLIAPRDTVSAPVAARRVPQPSRVCTFMQGTTRLEPVLIEACSLPGSSPAPTAAAASSSPEADIAVTFVWCPDL
jgi:hypothetical protein